MQVGRDRLIPENRDLGGFPTQQKDTIRRWLMSFRWLKFPHTHFSSQRFRRLPDHARLAFVDLACDSALQGEPGIGVDLRGYSQDIIDVLVSNGLIELTSDHKANISLISELYEGLHEKRAEAGRIGGLAKASKSQANSSICLAKPSKTCQTRLDQIETREETTIVPEAPSKRKKEQETIPPSIDDVRKYVTSLGYKIDIDYWFDYYEARGWKVGKTKMVSWKASLRTWKKNAASFGEQEQETFVIPPDDVLRDAGYVVGDAQ